MFIKLREMMTKKKGQKGFTLIELIIVLAILAILAAIAWPRYRAIQGVSRIRSDAATAQSICSAARLQESNEGTEVADMTALLPDYWQDRAIRPQSSAAGATFTLGKDAGNYFVTWETDGDMAPNHDGDTQRVTEGTVFTITP